MMNRILLIATLVLACVTQRSNAQDDVVSPYRQRMNQSATEKTFNVWDLSMNIRDFVFLKDAKIVVEMYSPKGFNKLKDIDNILKDMRKDIAFYRDSLENSTGNVRIDYVTTEHSDHKEIRFIQHKPTGDIYVNRSGEVSRLKMEQDTIRIIMWMDRNDPLDGDGSSQKERIHKMCCTAVKEAVQITFCLNNYSDIDKIIAAPAELHHAIDTLASLQSKTYEMMGLHRSSIVYKPNEPSGPFFYKTHNGIMKNETDFAGDYSSAPAKLMIDANIGAGLVMNTLAPTADIRLLFVNRWMRGDRKTFSFGGVVFSPYFFFDHDAQNNLHVFDNWFVSAEMGSEYGDKYKGWKGDITTFGVGYLLRQTGNYFQGPTFKMYTDIKFGRFTVSPEIFSTNNFKQFFPGITLKVF